MTSQKKDNLYDVGRVIALAERFAGEGQMNINKTLEAMAYVQIRRIAWTYRPEIITKTS